MPPKRPVARRAVLAAPLLAACTPRVIPAGPATGTPGIAAAPDALVMADGARLPLRAWLPDAPPRAVFLCLHGFNESRNFMIEPAPALNAAGIAVYAYDQRGFGAAPNRGIWPGSATLAADAAAAARLVRARHPGIPVVAMGESMGGAVLLVAAASADPPPVAGHVLLAPAVWGRETMPGFLVGLLDVLAHTIPIAANASSAPGFRPTDNDAAWARLSRDPLTIRETRVDAVYGLVGLMDDALAAAPRLDGRTPPMLLIYGGQDRLVPQRATRALLDRMPDAARWRIAYYPRIHHLPLRDLAAAEVITDLVSWTGAPAEPLPSRADTTGRAWRATPPDPWRP